MAHVHDSQCTAVRFVQKRLAQQLLFTMAELGDETIGLQLEFEGVVLSLVCLRVTQTEFEEIMKAAGDAETRASASRVPDALT